MQQGKKQLLFLRIFKKYAEKLEDLKRKAKENIRKSNKSIDKLIRKDLISAEMASSLFNDNTNVNVNVHGDDEQLF